jgi:hypothetical protein
VSGDSDCVHDTFSEIEAEEILKEILNVIDSFNVDLIYLSYLSNVYRACSFFMNLDFLYR